MTIYPFSPLQNVTNQIKQDGFDSNMFFCDSNNQLEYSVVVSTQYRNYDNSSIVVKYKLVESGLLKGKYNGSTYDYRFDFERYINFQVDEKLGVNKLSETLKDVYLVVGTQNVVSKYPSDFFWNDGDYFTTVSAIEGWSEAKQNFKFENKADGSTLIGYSTNLYENGYGTLSLSHSLSTNTLKANLIKTNGSFTTVTLTNSDAFNTKSKIYNIPSNVKQIEIILNNVAIETINVKMDKCDLSNILYYDSNSMLENLTTTLNCFQTTENQRDFINIGNRKIVKSSKKITRYHFNTGYLATEQNMTDIVNNAFLYTVNDYQSGEYTCEKWINDTNAFDSYNGLSALDKNIELILTKENEEIIKNNQTVTFFD